MNEVEKYLKILRDVRAGKTVSQADARFFTKFTYTADKATIKAVQDAKVFGDVDEAQAETAIRDTFLEFVQNPVYKSEVEDIIKSNYQEQFVGKATAGLNVALAGLDIATSIGQINESKRGLKRSRRPTAPAPLTAEPLLKKAISDASRGNYDTVRALAPAQLAQLDQYLSDMNQAKSVSGGQAGTYGALGQVASNRRGRGNLELAKIGDAMNRENQQRSDNLLGMKIGENAAIQNSQAQQYPYDLQQYRFDQDQAGAVGVAGRQNLRSSLTGASQNLPQIMAEIAARKRYNEAFNEAGAIGLQPEDQKMAAEVSRNMLINPEDNWN
jgi:hypothetical protein